MTMQTIQVRDKTYCEVAPAVWQRCDVPTVAMTAPPGIGITLAMLTILLISTLSVLPQVIERRREIESEITELMEVTKL